MVGIGIDLGTTYSCVFHNPLNRDEELIPSSEGHDLTPSVVYFDPDGSVLVGEEAKKLLGTDPENVVVGIKRHMGEDYPMQFHGIEYTPEAISGIILKRLAIDSAQHFGIKPTQLRSVITVPAYFGVAEKEATHAAAKIAQLECLELLAEPVAAAYAYGADPDKEDSSLVFDLGGGTFDVAVVGMVNRQPKIWAVDGETQLGGLDWDRRLNDIVWDRLVSQGIDESELYEEGFTASLLSKAETLKRSLSSHESASARIRSRSSAYSVSVTRKTFEIATTDLVAQCVEAAQRVMTVAHTLGSSPVSRILLVGGSTRMPMIRAALERECRLTTLIHDPDKAVARGAAILASKLLRPGGISVGLSSDRAATKRITPVLPKAIGIKTYSSKLPARSEPYVLNILPANTPLPVEGKQVTVATIVPDQGTARIELYEQAGSILSEDIDANRLLYDGEVTAISPCPAGSPIVLTLTVEIDGRISVAASDGTTYMPLQLEAFIHGVIDERELDEQIDKVSDLVMVI